MNRIASHERIAEISSSAFMIESCFKLHGLVKFAVSGLFSSGLSHFGRLWLRRLRSATLATFPRFPERVSMSETLKTDHPHVVRLEGVCGGEPVIDGLRVAVRHVVALHQRGETVLEIAEALGITEAQVFHALSYFFD